MATITIPSTSLPVGDTVAGPLTGLVDQWSSTLTVDRTITAGLNSLTSDSTMFVQVQSSPDGATWDDEVATTMTGGLIPAKGGGNRPTETLYVTNLTPGATEVRAVCTVAGPSAIQVAGSITTS